MSEVERLTRKEELEIIGDGMDEVRALGGVVELDPDDADDLGVVEEKAISWETAMDARFDHLIFGGDNPLNAGDAREFPVLSPSEYQAVLAETAERGNEGEQDAAEDDAGEYEDWRALEAAGEKNSDG